MFGFQQFRQDELYVSRPGSEIEPSEVILDTFAQAQKDQGVGELKMELPLSRNVLRIFYAVFICIVLVFLAKTIQFQIFSSDSWSLLAKENVLRETPIVPERGILYDQNFIQLVHNEPSFDFVCDKRDMPSSVQDKERILQNASSITKQELGEVKKIFDEIVNPEVLIAQDLSQEELVLIGAKAEDLEGCEVQENTKRKYTQGELYVHLLGYTSKISQKELQAREGYTPVDKVGKDGAEKTFEEILRGIPGASIVEKDAHGKEIRNSQDRDPIPGNHVVLWLDSGLQKTLVQSLQQVFADTGTKKGAAIALDPKTGGVLAMVSLPSFDANKFSEGLTSKDWNNLVDNSLSPLFNRVMGGIGFPTGSVIKPIIALAALQEGVVNENTVLDAPLELCVENIYTKEPECFRDHAYHGSADVKKAIAESVNPFFYIIGGGFEGFKGLGPNRIIDYLKKFGLGTSTGINLSGEGAGTLPTIDKNWRLGDTYHLAIGQGPFALTPLQVASAIGVFANKGKLMEPHIAKSIVDSKRNVIQEFNPVVLKENIADQKNIELVRQGMRQTVTNGSASGFLNRIPVKAAAKTGTAQTGRKTYDGKDYLFSWTAAFAPYDNPEIVLVVVVEDVQEGQVASLPVARDVFQWYFSK